MGKLLRKVLRQSQRRNKHCFIFSKYHSFLHNLYFTLFYTKNVEGQGPNHMNQEKLTKTS